MAAKPAKEKIQGKLIGLVTHYFPQVNAAVVKIDRSNLVVGDRVHIKGHTTDFKQTLNSLQIDRKPIEKAGKGDEIGVEVKARVRIGDEVYKL
ncbi:MAG: translation elongation factor-like protein [Candidatus Omnitrophica bacterium]|nr:translation elongation factor-like protein [Candidatus Omnitrophota bacterium]